jgi:hypothetical protein
MAGLKEGVKDASFGIAEGIVESDYITFKLAFRIIITSQYIAISCNCRLLLLC